MKINLKTLITSVIICFVPAIIGSLATSSSVSTWYPTLVKSPLNPPPWVFGPVWTILYLFQSISLYLVRTTKQDSGQKMLAYVFFGFQLFFNLLWSVLFFLLKSPGAALIEIGLLLISLIFTIIAVYRIHKSAAYLLLPYLAWISFASYLNLQVFILNR